MYNDIDTLNSFIVEFKSDISKYDQDQFESNIKLFSEGVLDRVHARLINPELYCNYIDKTIENLNSVSTDVQMLDDFFTKTYKSTSLADKNISIPLQYDADIEKIRPEYLTGVAMDFEVNIQKILKKEISSRDIKDKYASGEYFNKVKKQLVKTSIVINDVRDLLSIDDPKIVKVDNIFLQNNAIPFIRAYTQNSKDIIAIATNTKGIIRDCYDRIVVNNNAIGKVIKEGKLDIATIKTLNYYRFNIMRQFMNLCAYISAMIIRKSTYLTYNIMSYMTLYNTIADYFPEGEFVLHENVLDGKLSDLDDTAILSSMLGGDLKIILPHIQSVIGKKKMEIANVIAKKYNFKIDFRDAFDVAEYPYDTYPYASANKTVIDIIKNLKEFEMLVRENSSEDYVVDEIIERSSLDETFVSKYQDILTNIPNTNYYTAQMRLLDEEQSGAVTLSLFNDIANYEKNVAIISTNVNKCNNYIQAIKEALDENTTGMDDNTFHELQSFVDTIEKNYKDYVLQLTKKLLIRLDNLTDILDDTSVPDSSIPEEFKPYDYSFEYYKAELDDIEYIQEVKFESMMKDYYMIREKNERGIDVVYEEVTQAPAGATSTDVKTDAQEQQNNNTTSTTTSNTSSTNNSTSNNNNSTNSNNNQDKKSLIQKFKEWFTSILNKFREKSGKLASKNAAWLGRIKPSLQALDTSKTTITLAQYENVSQEVINKEITDAINKINSVDANNLPNELKGNRNKAELFLFPSIPAKIGKLTGFTERLKQFLTHGNNDNQNLVSYSGDDAKKKIDEMIAFCEGYGNIHKSIADNLDKLSQVAADKQTAIVNSVGESKPVTEASQNEVKQDGKSVGIDGGTKDKTSASSVITSVVREYAGAVLTIVEKKYLDYVKVLSKLAPNQSGNTAETQTSNDNTNDNNANNNGEQG